MKNCWRKGKEQKECEKSSCCYNSSAQTCFEYWKFAQSKEWKEILSRELERVKSENSEHEGV